MILLFSRFARARHTNRARALLLPALLAVTLVGVLSDVFGFVIYFRVHRGFSLADATVLCSHGIVYSRNFRRRIVGHY